jgi:imidazolonepropionase
MRFDRIWRNARIATMNGHAAMSGRPTLTGTAAGHGALGEIEDGVIASRDGRIAFVGHASDAPRVVDSVEIIDCGGRLVTPGLIDCHTHLVYAGDRAHEFERRLNGESYESIARSGGGILSTVRATREASEEQLVAQSLPRLDALLAEGVTTIEIKSGYGLSEGQERKQLMAAKQLERRRDVRVTTTFLGAHALPPEYAGRSDDYVREVCEVMLPKLATDGLIDAVDAFCEGIGFTPEQTQRVFEAATALRLRVKLHAEQLSNSHGAALAAKFRALSADHLEHVDEAGMRALAESGTTAVLLPGAYYFVRETHLPPIARLRELNVPIAVATDCNPGTSPLTSILLAMNLAATLFRLTVDECLIGVTRSAARALGLSDSIGTLEVGKACDLAIWNVARPAELVYRMGYNPLHERVWRGR